MSNIDKLRQSIDVKNSNKETENQRLIGEAIQKEHTKQLFKPITDKQNALNKQISSFSKSRRPVQRQLPPPQQIQQQIPVQQQQPIIEEVTEPLEYPEFTNNSLKQGIYTFKVSGKYRDILIYSEDKLDTMTPRKIRGHIENVNRYVDTMVKTINAKQTKPDRKQKLNEVYPDLRKYRDYLHYYISQKDKAPNGSGLKNVVVTRNNVKYKF